MPRRVNTSTRAKRSKRMPIVMPPFVPFMARRRLGGHCPYMMAEEEEEMDPFAGGYSAPRPTYLPPYYATGRPGRVAGVVPYYDRYGGTCLSLTSSGRAADADKEFDAKVVKPLKLILDYQKTSSTGCWSALDPKKQKLITDLTAALKNAQILDRLNITTQAEKQVDKETAALHKSCYFNAQCPGNLKCINRECAYQA